ncbi:MAG TPA: recombinase family protein [bacterium]|nr:recombinase family protein [bacterium]
MRVGIYARVSTHDKNQAPETQLVPMRDYVKAQGWSVVGEFVDKTSALDLRGREHWRELLSLAARRKLDVILVWKLDRAFRSVAHMVSTVEDLRRWGVGFRSYSEAMIDTSGTSPMSDLLLNILASVAQFERALISERVRAGMERAKRQGKAVGRPHILNGALDALVPDIRAGRLSHRQAARQLGVSASTVYRRLQKIEAVSA